MEEVIDEVKIKVLRFPKWIHLRRPQKRGLEHNQLLLASPPKSQKEMIPEVGGDTVHNSALGEVNIRGPVESAYKWLFYI